MRVNEQRERTNLFTREYLEQQLRTVLAGESQTISLLPDSSCSIASPKILSDLRQDEEAGCIRTSSFQERQSFLLRALRVHFLVSVVPKDPPNDLSEEECMHSVPHFCHAMEGTLLTSDGYSYLRQSSGGAGVR